LFQAASPTPFYDEEDEDAHEAYESALREGRMRLPSVGLGEVEDEDDDEDVPEGMESLGKRLVRSSQIEEGVVRVKGGWEDGGVEQEEANGDSENEGEGEKDEDE
jgi:hypothetical protein